MLEKHNVTKSVLFREEIFFPEIVETGSCFLLYFWQRNIQFLELLFRCQEHACWNLFRKKKPKKPDVPYMYTCYQIQTIHWGGVNICKKITTGILKTQNFEISLKFHQKNSQKYFNLSKGYTKKIF